MFCATNLQISYYIFLQHFKNNKKLHTDRGDKISPVTFIYIVIWITITVFLMLPQDLAFGNIPIRMLRSPSAGFPIIDLLSISVPAAPEWIMIYFATQIYADTTGYISWV